MAQSMVESSADVLVSVVGLAHVAGIEKFLTNTEGFSVVDRNCPLPK